jgi:hypothetical protein
MAEVLRSGAAFGIVPVAPHEPHDENERRFRAQMAEALQALIDSVRTLSAEVAAGSGGGGGGTLTDGDKGDITVSGSGASWVIDADAVTLAKMANIATARLLGRVTAGTGDPEALTGTQATTLLDVFTSLLKGLVPASGGGTINFLRADGSWAVPVGGGGLGETFETVSKNLDASDATYGYTLGELTSITYANGIVKTLAYGVDGLSTVTLSGSTPGGIDLVKTLIYSGGDLTSASYT